MRLRADGVRHATSGRLPCATRPAPCAGMDKKLLSVEETCEAMGGIARRTLYDWWSTGRGPRRIKLPNGNVKVREDWLEDWLLSLEVGGDAA